jgi:hypothetical protein
MIFRILLKAMPRRKMAIESRTISTTGAPEDANFEQMAQLRRTRIHRRTPRTTTSSVLI